MGDAVHRLVERLGGKVVQQQDGGTVTGEEVLQRQDLPAVAQRALRQQAELRQAVEHDPAGRYALDRPRRSGASSRPARGRRSRAGSAAGRGPAGCRAAPARRRGSARPATSRAKRPRRAQLLLRFRQGDVEAAFARWPRLPSGTAARASSCRCLGCLRPGTRARARTRRPERRPARRCRWRRQRALSPCPRQLSSCGPCRRALVNQRMQRQCMGYGFC